MTKEGLIKVYCQVMRGGPPMNVIQLAMVLDRSRESVRKSLIELQESGHVTLAEKRFESHCCKGIQYFLWAKK